jgi:hypothetical protein
MKNTKGNAFDKQALIAELRFKELDTIQKNNSIALLQATALIVTIVIAFFNVAKDKPSFSIFFICLLAICFAILVRMSVLGERYLNDVSKGLFECIKNDRIYEFKYPNRTFFEQFIYYKQKR